MKRSRGHRSTGQTDDRRGTQYLAAFSHAWRRGAGRLPTDFAAADRLVRKHMAFRSLQEVVDSHRKHGYVPTIYGETLEERALRAALRSVGVPVHPAKPHTLEG